MIINVKIRKWKSSISINRRILSEIVIESCTKENMANIAKLLDFEEFLRTAIKTLENSKVCNDIKIGLYHVSI